MSKAGESSPGDTLRTMKAQLLRSSAPKRY